VGILEFWSRARWPALRRDARHWSGNQGRGPRKGNKGTARRGGDSEVVAFSRILIVSGSQYNDRAGSEVGTGFPGRSFLRLRLRLPSAS